MSLLLLVINVIFIFLSADVICSLSLSSSNQTVDSKIGDKIVLDCFVNRNKWTLPTILQWYRSTNNHSVPIASQFDNYPVHVDDTYGSKYYLFSNGSLKIDDIQLTDNDTFECRLILIDRGLLDIKETYSLTLRVNELPRFINRSNPIQIAVQYSTVNLICQIYGVPSPIVKWYKVNERKKSSVHPEDSQLVLTNSDSFTLHNVDDSAAGVYKCVGENRLGSVQNDFQLLIQGSIYWRQFPASQMTKINDSIILKCEGQSSEPLQYQWLKDEISISDTITSQNRIHTFSDGMLSINNIQPSDHGSYVCKISILNSTSVKSKPAIVTVKYPPAPSRNRGPQNLTLIQGSVGLCPCLLDAYPPIQSVAWYRNRRSIRIEPKGGAYTIDARYALVIKSVEKHDVGEYFCRAQNPEGFGRDSIPFNVDVKEPIQFVSKLDPIHHTHENGRLVLSCIAIGTPSPVIKWFKNSIELNEVAENLTIDRIEKNDHGLYICQASNEYTTANMSTLVIVENTTPQAPFNVRYEQVLSNILLSWEHGYDGGQTQHFIIWYRMIRSKKGPWNQIRVLPHNATEFFLFDFTLQETYEIAIVGESDLGLGAFSSLISVYLNNNQDLSVGYFYHSNITDVLRPSPPVDLHLSYSGSNLYITWNHPNSFDLTTNTVYYVIQWRTSVIYNNQLSQQSVLIEYPTRSFILSDIKQAKYIIQIVAYSDRGIYSIPVETEINIWYDSIFHYYGFSGILLSIFCFLIAITVAIVCICIFFVVKYYCFRQYYCNDIEPEFSVMCWCLPSIQARLKDSTPMDIDRCHASLLKSSDFQGSPNSDSGHQIVSNDSFRLSASLDNDKHFSSSLTKLTTVSRCRNSVLSNRVPTPEIIYSFTSADSPHTLLSSSIRLTSPISTNDEIKLNSFFQPISTSASSPISFNDVECRRNSCRLPLEAVPELSELSIANSRYSFTQSLSSTNNIYHTSPVVQPSPVLITFDSSSLKRRP